jgi:large subunit ribosomal protein L21
MYAILEAAGKQYKVEKGSKLTVNKLDALPGKEIVFDRVLFIADGESITVGKPTVPNAKIIALVLKQDRDKKIIVFKKRRKKGYKKTQGHRQYITELEIKEIQYINQSQESKES